MTAPQLGAFESRQYELVLATRKALRHMFGLSPVRVRLDVDWASGCTREAMPFGPSVYFSTGESLSIRFNATFLPKTADESERLSEPFIRGDSVSIGLEKWSRVNRGVRLDSIHVVRADMSCGMGGLMHAGRYLDAAFDIEGVVARRDPSAVEAPVLCEACGEPR